MVEGEDNENFSDAGADKKSSYFTQPDSEVEVTQKMRQEGYDHKETTDDHGMHIVGLYKDKKVEIFFLVKKFGERLTIRKVTYMFLSLIFKLKTIIYISS